MLDLDLIEAGIPERDGCPVLRRIKAFITEQGVASTLLHRFRDRGGNHVSLGGNFVNTSDVSDSVVDADNNPSGDMAVLLKIREFTGIGGGPGMPVIATVEGKIDDASSGLVTAKLPKIVFQSAGIYSLSWGFIRAGQLKFVNSSLLSVERNLFGFDQGLTAGTDGPPTINEIRMQMYDSDPADAERLGEVEFNDDQLILAMSKPIEYFNNTNPPLSVRYDTRTFPFRHEWADATIGYLMRIAADWYRRNRLAVTGGGKQLDANNREREYLQASELRLTEWKDFVLRKKCTMNMIEMVGHVGSSYGGMC